MAAPNAAEMKEEGMEWWERWRSEVFSFSSFLLSLLTLSYFYSYFSFPLEGTLQEGAADVEGPGEASVAAVRDVKFPMNK